MHESEHVVSKVIIAPSLYTYTCLHYKKMFLLLLIYIFHVKQTVSFSFIYVSFYCHANIWRPFYTQQIMFPRTSISKYYFTSAIRLPLLMLLHFVAF